MERMSTDDRWDFGEDAIIVSFTQRINGRTTLTTEHEQTRSTDPGPTVAERLVVVENAIIAGELANRGRVQGDSRYSEVYTRHTDR
jgi:hypothetical protein